MKIGCVFLLAVILGCYKISAIDPIEGQAVQVVSPKNHVFYLELEELKPILENDAIKDRSVVIVSIAGAFRQGKSFLLNFFIKYLYAQYKSHDVSDWMGENEASSKLNGFKWRGGRKRETTGIWMWSDVFTHDFRNGEKVAIILLDTQGIFDDQTSMKECTTIFALSIMLSSVQCYNVMHKIREDDLQHLEMFTEYGRLAIQQSSQKPFQKMLFIVRDWPYAFETQYGWHGQKVIDEILAGNDEQTDDMRDLRSRIDSSFDNIGAFLMPFPGRIVAQGNNFTGDLQQIDPDFKKYVQKLVTGIFAPEKLIVKKINGQKVRVRDLIQYLDTYLNIFNGDTLPEPRSIFMATAEASLQILSTDFLNMYVNTIQAKLNEIQSYLSQNELLAMHQKMKNDVIEQFQAAPKLGGDRIVSSFQRKIDKEIEEKFQFFNETNEMKYKSFVEKANLHNEKIITDIKELCERQVIQGISNSTGQSLRQSDLNDLSMILRRTAFEEFDSKKMGNTEVSKSLRESLIQYLDNLQLKLVKLLESYLDSSNYYTETMEKAIEQGHLSQDDLIKLHQNTKKDAKIQFLDKTRSVDDKLSLHFERRIENELEHQFSSLEKVNDGKRNEFIGRANAHNEIIYNEIKAKFENRVLSSIGKNYLSDSAFINLFISSKISALEEFSSRKMGDGQISNGVREKLERDLDQLQASLKQTNEANKPPPPPPPPPSQKDNSRFNSVLDFAAKVIPVFVGAFSG